MFEKDGSAGTLRPIIMAKCGFGGARPPGEPPSMTQPRNILTGVKKMQLTKTKQLLI